MVGYLRFISTVTSLPRIDTEGGRGGETSDSTIALERIPKEKEKTLTSVSFLKKCNIYLL